MNSFVRRSSLLGLCCVLFLMAVGNARAQSSGFLQSQLCGLEIGTGSYQSRIGPPSNFLMKPATASILVTYTGFTAQAESAFAYSARIWASILISTVPIKVNAIFTALPGGLLGVGLPNIADTLFDGRWLNSALADAIAGRDLNPGHFDMDLYLNSAFPGWYFGTDGNPPSDRIDFVTLALHELCHGIGFATTCKVQSGLGSYGMLTQSDFPGLVFSFPWPNFARRQDQFVRFVENAAGQSLVDTMLFANPSAALATQMTSNNVFFNGPRAVLANNGNRPKLYAPSPFALGVSILHLDQNTFPPGNINNLMTPFAFPGTSIHTPGPIVLGIFRDVGWRIDTTFVGVSEEVVGLAGDFRLEQNYPNPFNPTTTISFSLPRASVVRLVIYNLLGQEVMTLLDEVRTPGHHSIQWNGENSIGNAVGSGVYIFRLMAVDDVGQSRFSGAKKMILTR